MVFKAKFVMCSFFLLGVGVLNVGCHTAYHEQMTNDERVIARYEQQVKGRWFKRGLIDLISLGFAEFWYQHATSSYEGVMTHQKQVEEAENSGKGGELSRLVEHAQRFRRN